MKEEPMQLLIKTKRTAYICAELDDESFSKTAAESVKSVVEECRGKVTESAFIFGTLTIIAAFPHRRLKALEQAVKEALAGLPVREVVVWPTDPFKLRKNRAA